MVTPPSRRLAVILHADVVGSTILVRQNELIAHERIQAVFRRFSESIKAYGGIAHELRGDALIAEFDRASNAVSASLAFQQANNLQNEQLSDDIRPMLRIGIAMGEVVIADNTVTGEGVVLAQRLEQLAVPGGICIQGATQETIPIRFPFEYESLGERELKGFDVPVRVYAVKLKSGKALVEPESQTRTSEIMLEKPAWKWLTTRTVALILIVSGGLVWWQPWEPHINPTSVEQMAFPLPDKPSIAVLPFTNISDDIQQEYFVDGMTEDLITDLSQLSGLFVIARNSVFTYKNKPVMVKQVAEELGVRYVLEGSVRRAGGQVRINAQLIDATTGGHLWAERYDSTITDVFALQDQVTRKVVAALSLKLTPTEERSRTEAETSSIEAYDEFLRGWEHYKKRTPEQYAKALTYFAKAVLLDPNYGRAHAATAWIHWDSASRGWTVALGMGKEKAKELAKESIKLALQNPTPLAYQVVAKILLTERKHDEAITEARLSLAIDPNDADGYYALAGALIMAGRPREVSELLEKARRLDPHSQDYYSYIQGMAEFGLNRFKTAAELFERAIELNPDYWEPDRAIGWCGVCELLAATYGHLGRLKDAEAMLQKIREYWPRYNVNTATVWWPYKNKDDSDRFANGLRKAGLPDFVGIYLEHEGLKN